MPEIDLKRFSGIMNLDDPNDVMPPFHHKFLMNGRFRGNGGNMRVETIPGNVLIPNYLLPAGNNEQNGGFYDTVKRRIIWFNWNSNGRNGIYKYDISTKQLSKIFLCFTDSATDILNFSLDYPIHSAGIIYRPDSDGDLLCWVQGNGRPSILNIDTVSLLAPFTQDMINAAKDPPLTPLVCTYQNDATVNANNLRKKLFRFSQRWIYKNGEKSTISTYSKVPIPVNGYDPDTDSDPTFNNNIKVPVYGGGDDYQSIELLMQWNEGNTWSDWMSVVTLDRDDYNINPSATYNYYFYNNSIYPFIDPSDSTLYWDRIPNIARTMEVLAGNHIIYANTTDGYNGLSRSGINVNLTTGLGSINIPTISFTTVSGSSIIINIGATITTGAIYSVSFDYEVAGVPSTKNINYTTLPGDTRKSVCIAIAALLNGSGITSFEQYGVQLSAIAVGALPVSISNVNVALSLSGSENAAPSWKWSCPQRLGIQYLDEWDKPVGGVYSFTSDSALDTTDFAVTTPDFAIQSGVVQVPFIAASINHTPPDDAVSYHWVRAELTPKFIYWNTTDYQTDADYLYLGIQNLYYQNTQSTGFVPTYDFSKGDRVRVIASYGGTYVPYNIQLDFEILGVVSRTMNVPSIQGTFLKVAKPTTFPTNPYTSRMLVEIYTPLSNLPSTELVFKEWGEKYDIYEIAGVRYHRGQLTDQTSLQAATFQWFDGDVYSKGRGIYQNVNDLATVDIFIMDANYNDYWPSAVNSNGRGWLIDANAKEITNSVEIRWGGAYQQDTSINQLNRFRPENIDVLDLSKGDILRILAEKREVYFYHSRQVGSLGIYAKYIKNNQGQQQLIATDDLITKNNIYYLSGRYGLQNQPTAVFRGEDEVHYFIDCTNGDQLRRSGDGITNLGNLYYGQYTISNFLTPYNSSYIRLDGAKARILGYYDYFENEAHFILQGGTYQSNIIPDYNLSFNEKRNGYTGFYDFHPEAALQAASLTYSWKNGQLYIHNDEGKNRRFYGKKFYPSITIVFNDKAAIIKTMKSIGYQSEGKIWVCSNLNSFSKGENIDAIITSTINEQTGFRQSSRLKDFNFSIENAKTTAGLLRDINSGQNGLLALNEGDFLWGNWIEITFTYKGSDYVFMYEPYLNWAESNRNF